MGMKERLIRFRSFWIFPLLSIALIYFTSRHEPQKLRDLAWLVPIGMLFWTLLEYLLHRFLFHVHFRSRTLHSIRMRLMPDTMRHRGTEMKYWCTRISDSVFLPCFMRPFIH